MREVLIRGRDDRGEVELPIVESPLLARHGFRHGFSTRKGGVSAPPFDSLNLGGRWGDDRRAVAENWRRVGAVAGGPVWVASQVHGADVIQVRASSDRDLVRAQQADALIARDAGVVVGAVAADCVPVLVGDSRTGACAAVHAGWRGTVAGVVGAAVAAMCGELGSRPQDLRVAIGPCIGPCCFEVGAEVVAAVLDAFPDARGANAVLEVAGQKPHIDLPALNRLATERCGVEPDAVEVARLCTRCEADRFFSYRRDRGITGQQVGFISPRA